MTDAAALTPSQIKYFAQKQGFAGADLDIAVAVALAESGGNPTAHNATPPDNSYGLWQINMLGNMGPARRKQIGISSNDELYDPNVNAKAAHLIFKSQGWNGWSTYTHGQYKRHLSDAKAAKPVNNVGRTSDQETAFLATVRDDATPDSILGGLNALSGSLFKVGSNVGGIIVAVVLLIVGVLLLVLDGGGGQLLKKAAKATPVGKVL
jgi:hypothetical protein